MYFTRIVHIGRRIERKSAPIRDVNPMNTATRRNDAKAAALAAWPIYGAAAPTGGPYGIYTSGDVLVDRTRDGVNLDDLWTELRGVFEIVNDSRTALINVLSYWHTDAATAQQEWAGDFFVRPAPSKCARRSRRRSSSSTRTSGERSC